MDRSYIKPESNSLDLISALLANIHDDVFKSKHFPCYWPFVRGIHQSPVNSPHKGQWRGALMFSLICTRINGLVNNDGAGDLRRYRAHYDVIVMLISTWVWYPKPGGILDHKQANIRPGLVAPLRFRFRKHPRHGQNEAQKPRGEDGQNNLKMWHL